MFKKKYILVFLIISICLLFNSQILSQSELELIKTIRSSCYKYFKGEYHQDTTFSGMDTVKCTTMGEKIRIIRTFKKGSKVLVEAFYDNSKKYKIKSFLKGKEHDVSRSWYKNGKKKDFFYYNKGYKFLSILWYKDGFIKSIAEGEQHKGVFYKTIDFDTLGNIESIAYRPDSTTNAIYNIIYYPSALKMVETIYNDGRNPYVTYYKKGNKHMKGEIFQVEFARVGNWKEWYEDGIMKREYFFNDSIPNQREGIWKYWDEQGNLINQEEYKGGKLIKEKPFIKINVKND